MADDGRETPDRECNGVTALGQCRRKALYVIGVPNESTQFACGIHIGQVVKRWVRVGARVMVAKW